MSVGWQELAFVVDQGVVDGNHVLGRIVGRGIALRPDESFGIKLVRAFQSALRIQRRGSPWEFGA
jgi:hypothetical protein